MKPSTRPHRLAVLLACGLTTVAMGPASADLTTRAMPWLALAAASSTAQTTAPAPAASMASTASSRARGERTGPSAAASGPHSDGADAVLRDRQRATAGHALQRADRQFVAHALAAGQAEVELSRLAESRAQDAELKRFAERMVEDHTRVNGELRALADTGHAGARPAPLPRADRSAGMESAPRSGTGALAGHPAAASSASSASGPGTAASNGGVTTGITGSLEPGSPRLSAAAERTLQRLQGLTGTAFDRAFIRQMVSDHRTAVADFQKAASGAADPGVREIARQTLPGLQEHLGLAQALSDRLGRGQP